MVKYSVGKLEGWDFVVITLYFLAVIGVGIYSLIRANRGTVSGYFLAGRHMIWLPVGASIFASNIGSEHFIGLAGSGAAAGIAVGAFELNACMLLQLLGYVFLPVYIASGVCTLPEYTMKRFGRQRIRVYLAVLSLVLYIFTKISVNLYSGALFIQQALNWNIYVAVFILLAVTALTTITGGLTAVIYTDTLQMFVMVVGSVTLAGLSFKEVGGYTELYHGYMNAIPNSTLLNGTLSNSTCGLPRADAWTMLRDPVNSDLPWPGFMLGQTTASIWYWCADQMMVQRALSAKSLAHAQGGTLFAGYLKILPLFVIVLPGMISRVLYTDDVACADPVTCTRVCGNAVGCSNIAYPKLVLELMPTGLRGLMLSVMLAALMSDLTSIFNSASTLFTMDIYRLVRRQARTRELMFVGRLFVCLMVVVGILWIPIIQNMQGAQLFIYIQVISAYLSPPIACVFTLAIIWARTNETGAFWGLMAGMVVGVVRMVLDFVYGEPGCGEEDTRAAILQIHYMYFALILFSLTALTTVVISLLTEPPTEKQISKTTYFRRYDNKETMDCTDNEQLTPSPEVVNQSQSNREQNDASVAANGSNMRKHDEDILLDQICDETVQTEKDTASLSNHGNDVAVTYEGGIATITKQASVEVKRTKSTSRTRKDAITRNLLKWFCGFEEETTTAHDTAEMEKRIAKVTSLKRRKSAKIGLCVGLVVLFAINISLFVFFTAGSNAFGLIK